MADDSLRGVAKSTNSFRQVDDGRPPRTPVRISPVGPSPAFDDGYLQLDTAPVLDAGRREPGPPTPSESLDVNAAYKRALQSSQGMLADKLSSSNSQVWRNQSVFRIIPLPQPLFFLQ